MYKRQAQDIAALIQPIQTWLAPVYWLTMAMINGNLSELLKLIGLSSLIDVYKRQVLSN